MKLAMLEILQEKYGMVEEDFPVRRAHGGAGGQGSGHRPGPFGDRRLWTG